LIREYETVSGGRVRGEFIDPMEKPELEKEAAEKYGIKPVPFQVSDKYQAGSGELLFQYSRSLWGPARGVGV
jgi:hypothetical protein